MSAANLVEEPRPRFAVVADGADAAQPPDLRTKVALAAAMINIFGLVTSLFTMTVYDRVVPNNALSSLVALSVGLAVVVVFDFILRICVPISSIWPAPISTMTSANGCSTGSSGSGST